MPTNIYTPEFPSVTGLLDEDALVVGHFPDAHVLRSIGAASNRLAGRGNYLVHEVFRRAGNDEQIGTTGFNVGTGWQRIRDFPACERKPHLSRADVRIRARITPGASVVFQIATAAVAFRRDATRATTNTIVANGTGNFELYQGQIELGRSTVEDISLHAYGDPTGALANTAIYGSPNTGLVNDARAFVNRKYFAWDGSTWNTNIRRDRIMIAFRNSSNLLLLGPLRVQATFLIGTWYGLEWDFPGGVQIQDDELQTIQQPGAYFELLETPTIRLSSVTIRERDAYAT